MKPPKEKVALILIETDDAYIQVGPFLYCGAITNAVIKNEIYLTFKENGAVCSMKDVRDIVVVFGNSEYHGLLSPKIEEVWPESFFGKYESR